MAVDDEEAAFEDDDVVDGELVVEDGDVVWLFAEARVCDRATDAGEPRPLGPAATSVPWP